MENKKDEVMKKWASIIESTEKKEWLSKYSQSIESNQVEENTLASEVDQNNFPSIFPMAMRVASRTVGMDLVSVNPMDAYVTDEMIKDVDRENRDRKIESITEDKEYNEMKIEEHPDYKKGPTGKLFYLDFKYDKDN